jgi:hypothetical protein
MNTSLSPRTANDTGLSPRTANDITYPTYTQPITYTTSHSRAMINEATTTITTTTITQHPSTGPMSSTHRGISVSDGNIKSHIYPINNLTNNTLNHSSPALNGNNSTNNNNTRSTVFANVNNHETFLIFIKSLELSKDYFEFFSIENGFIDKISFLLMTEDDIKGSGLNIGDKRKVLCIQEKLKLSFADEIESYCK